MTTRVSRRKERAARRRSLRVQRGGVTITGRTLTDVLQQATAIKKASDIIRNPDLTQHEKDKLLLDISNAPGTYTDLKPNLKEFIKNSLGINPQGGNEVSAAPAGGAAAAPEVTPAAPAAATVAPWYKVPEERNGVWIAAVSTLDISSILVPLIESGNITPDAYIEVLARQNDLFKLAFDIIRDKLKKVIEDNIKETLKEDITEQEKALKELKEGMTDPFILVKYSKIIKDKSETLMEYINDVEKLIINTQEQGNTKLTSIRSRNEDMFELLLFPGRLQNLLIKAVANLCVMIVQEKNFSLLNKSELKPLLIKQYSSYAESLAYTQTAVAMRDGYYLSQDISGILLDRTAILALEEEYKPTDKDESLTAFWKDFIVTLYELAPDGTELFKTPVIEDCDKSMNQMSWGQIAANICMMYKRKLIVDKNYKEAILKIFDGSCNLAVNKEIPGAPPMALWGERLTKIFTYIRPDTLEFMLHLANEITKAATPPTSSGPEHPSSQGNGE